MKRLTIWERVLILSTALALTFGAAYAVSPGTQATDKSTFVFPAFSPPRNPLICGQDAGLGCALSFDAGVCVRIQAQGEWGYTAQPDIAPDGGFDVIASGTGCALANFSPTTFNVCTKTPTLFLWPDAGDLFTDGGGVNLPDGGGYLLLDGGVNTGFLPIGYAGVGPIRGASLGILEFWDGGCTVPAYQVVDPLFYICATPTATNVAWYDGGATYTDAGGINFTDGGGEVLYTDGGGTCGLVAYPDAGLPAGPDGGNTFICPYYTLNTDAGCAWYLDQDAGNQFADGGTYGLLLPDAGLLPAPLYPDGGGNVPPTYINFPDGGVVYGIGAGVIANADGGPGTWTCTAAVSTATLLVDGGCNFDAYPDGGYLFPDGGGWVYYTDGGIFPASALPDGGVYVQPDGGNVVGTYSDGGNFLLPTLNYLSDGDKEAWCFAPPSYSTAIVACSVDGGTFGVSTRQGP